MKKYKNRLITFLCLFACLLVIPMQVHAANKAVTVTSAEASTSTVSVSGTSDALAVMVQVRDESENILVMKSFGTESKKFSGKIENLSLTDGKTYKIYLADYEGGDWTIKEVVAKADATPTPTKSAPTGDLNNISQWMLLAGFGCVLVALATVMNIKKRNE